MIRVSMLYPAGKGSHFDFVYYIKEHLPLSERLLARHGFLSYEVQRCTGTLRGDPPAFLCITHLDFTSMQDFQDGMACHGDELRADFARYTNVTPMATVSELAIKRQILEGQTGPSSSPSPTRRQSP